MSHKLRRALLFTLLLPALACSMFQSSSTPNPVWTYSNERIQHNSFEQVLHIVDGNAYAYLSSDMFSPDGLLGLNGATGQELYPPTFNEELEVFEGIFGNMAIFRGGFTEETNSDGNILFTVIAYDLNTGTEAWRHVGITDTTSISGVGNHLFLWKSSTEMDILDLQSGSVLSTYMLNDVDASEYADLNPAWVHFIYGESAFYSLTPAGIWREYSLPDAKLVNTLTLNVPYYIDTMFIEDGRLYLYAGYEIGQDVSLLVYDLSTGNMLWELPNMYSVHREVALQNGTAYLNTLQGTTAVDMNTGQVLWATGGSMNASFTVNAETKGRLIVADTGSMSAYDATTGETLWSFEPGLENVLRITAVDGIAFVTSADAPPAFESIVVPSRLDAVDIETGKLLWRFEQAWVTLPIPAGDLLIVAYYKGISAFAKP